MEHDYWPSGIRYLVGVDEVGRGAAAGPVLAAAVLLPVSWALEGVKDSKKLSPKKRAVLCSQIKETALSHATAVQSNHAIDQINIRNATLRAMRDAVLKIASSYPIDLVLVDGNDPIPGLDIPQRSVIDGEEKSISIAAASIVAKQTRDAIMATLDEEMGGQYRWAKNKGYLTKEHTDLIIKHGPAIYHRRTFIKRLIAV